MVTAEERTFTYVFVVVLPPDTHKPVCSSSLLPATSIFSRISESFWSSAYVNALSEMDRRVLGFGGEQT